MAPSRETVAPDPETRFLLSVLLNCNELNLDTEGLMEAEGMSRKDKGVEKFRRILGKYGYKYENKQVLRTADNGEPALENLEKPMAATKKPKGKGAPRSKKRKLDGDMAEDGEGKDVKGESE